MFYIKEFFRRFLICIVIIIVYSIAIIESVFNLIFFVLRFLFLNNTFDIMRITLAIDGKLDGVNFLKVRDNK